MKADEVKVGAVTLGGIVILALMLTFLGVFSFAGRTYKLNVMFDDVNGLKVGNEVRFAGVPVGKVDDIVVDGSKVKVVMKMDEKQKIPRNSQFAIGMDGVMGTKFVTIAPPKIATGLVFKAGETITGQQAGGIDKLMDSSGKVLDKLEVVVDAFSNVFGDKNVQKSMREGFVQTGEVAKNMNAFTKALATMAQQNQRDIHAMAGQMKEMSIHMNSIMDKADADGATGRNVAAMAANMADASKKLQNTAAALQDVVTDPQTQQELKETIRHAKSTSVKADKILGVVTDAQVQADVLYNDKKSKWRTDMGVKLPLKEDAYAFLGVSDIGDRDKLNFHYNKKLNKYIWGRAGVMEGQFGVGADWVLSPKFRLFTDFYDFDDAKLKVGAEYAFTPKLSLIGESMDVLEHGADTAYVGLRARF